MKHDSQKKSIIDQKAAKAALQEFYKTASQISELRNWEVYTTTSIENFLETVWQHLRFEDFATFNRLTEPAAPGIPTIELTEPAAPGIPATDLTEPAALGIPAAGYGNPSSIPTIDNTISPTSRQGFRSKP